MAKATLLLLLILSGLLVSAYAHGGGHGDDDDADAAGADGDGSPDLRSKSLILVKIWCLIIVFVATFAGGISPYFFKWNEAFIALGTQFAAGVFLATALIHFLSDANETFEDLTTVDYPFAFMLASAGFVVTMLADSVITLVVDRGRAVRDAENGQGNFQQSKEANRGDTNLQPETTTGSGDQSVASLLRQASSLGDSILLIVALCFHSVFEGIAIGVAETKGDAWKALWTISLHKVFAAVAMGIALLRMMPDRPLLSCASYAFAFAISSPVGVAIGIIIDATTEGKVADWIYAISMGLACGVFIYVSINHLIVKGYKTQRRVVGDSPIGRWLAVTFGVAVISVVMIWDT